MQKEFSREAKTGFLTPQAREDLREEEIQVLATYMVARVVGGAWAVMDEHGTGSLMETAGENPALQRYVSSELFNPLRRLHPNYPRVGRAKGVYRDIFGRMRRSSGALAGRDLEALARQGALRETFLPTPPSRALRTAARWLNTERGRQIMRDSMHRFPWGRFLREK